MQLLMKNEERQKDRTSKTRLGLKDELVDGVS